MKSSMVAIDAISLPGSIMKGRPRGESDLGRPNVKFNGTANGYAFSTVLEGHEPKVSSIWQMPGSLLAVLFVLPYIFASLAFSPSTTDDSPIDIDAYISRSELDFQTIQKSRASLRSQGAKATLLACALSSGTLLLVGMVAKVRPPKMVLDRRKSSIAGIYRMRRKIGVQKEISRIAANIAAVGLPFYAALQLGGIRVATILLSTTASGLSRWFSGREYEINRKTLVSRLGARKFTAMVLVLGTLLDLIGITSDGSNNTFLGYLALAISLFALPFPFNNTPVTTTPSKDASVTTPPRPWESPRGAFQSSPSASSLIASPYDVNITILTAASLSIVAALFSLVSGAYQSISYRGGIFSALSITAATINLFTSQPSPLVQRKNLAIAFAFLTVFSLFSVHNDWVASSINYFLPVLLLAAVLLESSAYKSKKPEHSHQHSTQNKGAHGAKHSRLSGYLLTLCEPNSILHSILIEKDSRRIAYFAMLNLAFMIVQFFYGFVTGSLGLLSDSIHMLFDCLGLAVGLAAAVMSKWHPTPNFPYGYGKIDTLSGFANGIFLMLVSVEIIFDAFGRLAEGSELTRLNELLIISILGFFVNIVGLTAFGHAHHGHGHGHGHSHSHSHGHGHDHNHDHSSKRSPSLENNPLSPKTSAFNTQDSPSRSPALHSPKPVAPTHGHAHHDHSHSHSHDNENMQGIFLHILADALGSFAVIVSTILTKVHGWSGWDPLASCMIAVLIFFSAIPLVRSSGQRLLLSLPADVEYALRSTLQEISGLRGVAGYAVPRFWLEDGHAAAGHEHEHEHEHEHKHEHKYENDHGHHHHDHDHHHGRTEPNSHANGCSAPEHPPAHILGVIHIIAAKGADAEDVRERTAQVLKSRGMNVVVHVEREGEGRCWCGGGAKMG